MKLKQDKKGDVASIIYIVIFLFVMAIVLFFISHMNREIYGEVLESVNETTNKYPEARDTIADIRQTEIYLWDYAFLGIFLGSLVVLVVMGFAVRISPVFYWIYGIVSLIILALGVVLSNVWQGMVADPEFATTLTYFPITNALLGSYFPLVVSVAIITLMVILFGKSREQEEGFI